MLQRGNAGLARALTWSGTFHAIGARLLREYAPQIGLDRAFTIHDREDSADLINLIRHDLGLSKTEKRFPTKGTCLAIYSRAVNAETPLGDVLDVGLSLVRDLGSTSCGDCSRPMSKPSSASTCSITTICCSTGRR